MDNEVTLDPKEIVAIGIETLGGRDALLECEPGEIARFCEEIKSEENLANRGAGMTLITSRGDHYMVIAGIDCVRLYTRETMEMANEQAKRTAAASALIRTGRR